MISLALIAPQRFYREGLAALFAERAGFDVVATAAGRDDALPLVQRHQPHVALVALGSGTGALLVRELRDAAPRTRVVMLGIADDDPEVLPLAEAGVSGYVTTEASGEEIAATVTSIARGEMPCSPRLAAALLDRVASLAAERRAPSQLASLTVRERQVVELLSDGLSNKEIARGLQIEVATVKNHVHSILEKLNVARRSDVAAVARRDG